MADHPDRPDARGRAFYGRRKGHRLRRGRAGLLARRLPGLALDLGAPSPTDLRTLFPVPVERVAIEIGFGGGEHFVREALADPATGCIGCEPFVNGVAAALSLIEAHGVGNVRLHAGDAAGLLAWLPDASLVRVDLLYPDPWPKKRHRKRRFVSAATVAEFARILAPGGIVRFATDIADYAEWTLLRFLRSEAFDWRAERADDWRRPWPGFAGTRYEAKALRAGRAPCYLVFRRR